VEVGLSWGGFKGGFVCERGGCGLRGLCWFCCFFFLGVWRIMGEILRGGGWGLGVMVVGRCKGEGE